MACRYFGKLPGVSAPFLCKRAGISTWRTLINFRSEIPGQEYSVAAAET
jgi:hypothetical protein